MATDAHQNPLLTGIVDAVIQQLLDKRDLHAAIVRSGTEMLDPAFDRPVFERQTKLTHDGSPLCGSRDADNYIGSRSSLNRLIKRGLLPAYKCGRNNLFLRDRCRRIRELILAGRLSPGLERHDGDDELIAELDASDRKWLAEFGGDLTLPDKTASSKPPT